MQLNFQEKELLREVFNKSFHEARYEIEVSSPGSRQQLSAMNKRKELMDLYNTIFRGKSNENIV